MTVFVFVLIHKRAMAPFADNVLGLINQTETLNHRLLGEMKLFRSQYCTKQNIVFGISYPFLILGAFLVAQICPNSHKTVYSRVRAFTVAQIMTIELL